MDREEANYRSAVRWAVADQQHQAAASLGHTFRDYLERSGRLRQRDAWVQWLRDAVTQAGFTADRGREGRLPGSPLPPNRTAGSPGYGSPVGGFTSERID